MLLLKLALLPAILFCAYIYNYDKDKEPCRLFKNKRQMALLCFGYGVISAAPIILTERFLAADIDPPLSKALYESFITASLPEELFKLILIYLLIFYHRDFNTPFDGIFYSVFLCMGFAATENVGYVFHPVLGGIKTAVLRAVFSVPGHGIFASVMGYFLCLSKFRSKSFLLAAFFAPFIIHGVYDFILIFPIPNPSIIFLSYFAFLIILCFILKKKTIA